MARKSKTSPGAQPWWEEPELVADTTVPKVNTGRPRFLYWLVASSMVLLPLSLIGNIAAVGQIVSSDEVVADTYTSSTRPAAAQALNQWLDSDPAPIPAAQVLSWQGFTTQNAPVKDGDEPISADLHTFAVASGEAVFDVTVTVARIGDTITALGTPALALNPGTSTDVPAGQLWGDRALLTSTDEIEQAVKTFAAALFSGDATELRQAVGDPDTSHSYLPIYGATFSSVSIDALASTDSDSETNPTTETAFAQITIAYRFAPSADPDNADAHASSTFDVLITDADTGTPKVVAWGGAGQAPTLAPYGNAVIVTDDTPAATASPVPATPTATATDSEHKSTTPP